MSLSPGTRLGPYEIVGFLGAGGMGEVYRARDPRLGRDVAVKVLPPSVSTDPERLRRFEQEARATGALDHPNIVVVHDVGSHDGIAYVVSELLEGSTLRERCAAGPIPARKAVDYATQIARGLAAAHDKGIVHRDLKPENVFVTRAGQVKILDFGLAKLAQAAATADGATTDPTRTRDTGPGTVLGTVGYMSPEQVRAQRVDHRSDVFSLGVILYEMLTGQRAFRAETAADTMTAILREEPALDPASQSGITPALERVVRHCLEKDADERFQSARDLVFDLETISGPSAVTAPPTRPRAWRTAPAAALASLLAMLVAVPAAYELGRRSRGGTPPQLHRLTFRRGTVTSARFAPDGQTIVYGAEWEGQPVALFSTGPGSPESRHLGLPSADILSISRSGEMALALGRRALVGWESSGTLARAPLSGGAPREVLANVQDAEWTPDGEELAVVRVVAGRSRLEFPIGRVLYQTGGWISHPRFSPKKDWLAFFEHPIRGDNSGWVAAVDLDGKKKDLSEPCAAMLGLSWEGSGSEVFYSGNCPSAPARLEAVTLSGRHRSIAQFAGGALLQDIARDGRVLVAFADLRREIVGRGPGADAERNLSWLDWSFPRDLSADGTTLLIEEQGGGAPRKAIYVRKMDGSQAVRLAEGRALALSPDGEWALCDQAAGTGSRLVLLPIGPGEPRVLLGPRFTYQWANWHPGGKRIVFAATEAGHGNRLYVLDLAGGQPQPFTAEGIGTTWRGLSPDGNVVAALAPDRTLSLFPIAGGEPRPVPGLTDADAVVGWSSDSRSLYVQRRSDRATVYQVDITTGEQRFWKEFRLSDPAGVPVVSPILVGPDAKSYVYSYRRLLSDLYLVEGLR